MRGDVEISAIASQGLQQAQDRVDQTAAQIAAEGAAAVSQNGPPVDAVDLSQQVVGLMSARDSYEVNLKMLQTGNELDRQTIDLLA
jgi:flagellar basal body rod protein FlgG